MAKSPCFELAFSRSFKELGSRNLKAKLWKIKFPFTDISKLWVEKWSTHSSIHRKLKNQLNCENICEYSLHTSWIKPWQIKDKFFLHFLLNFSKKWRKNLSWKFTDESSIKYLRIRKWTRWIRPNTIIRSQP